MVTIAGGVLLGIVGFCLLVAVAGILKMLLDASRTEDGQAMRDSREKHKAHLAALCEEGERRCREILQGARR